MKTTLKKWGNSHGVRLPKYVLETMGWSEDEALEVLDDGDKLIIKRQINLKRLMSSLKGMMGAISRPKSTVAPHRGEKYGKTRQHYFAQL